MKKLLFAVGVVVLGAVAAVALRGRGAEWTTRNPVALEQFGQGLAASMKYYRNEARLCFAKAVEADPAFLVAKAMLLDHLDPRRDRDGAAALLAELANADLTPLTPRERFLVERILAVANRDLARASELTQGFLTRSPNDPFGLFLAGQDAVLQGDFATAKEIFGRLIDRAPNWVMAYNHLGYIAMAEGQLDEAERMFTTYRFIAPDQANPHDSLGELFLLTGRLDEAEHEFEMALQARLDFSPAYENLVRVETLRGDSIAVEAALFRAQESGALSAEAMAKLECWARGWLAAREGDWLAVAELAQHTCGEALPLPLALRAALFTGRSELERATLERAAATAREQAPMSAQRNADREATLNHLEGLRAAAAGQLSVAAERFRAAAAASSTWGFPRGFAKLANLATLATTLEQLGRANEAAAAWAAMRAINPHAAEMLGRGTDLPPPRPPS